ncbi:MAG: hypothetical protein ACREB3_16315, partial [Burkholderiales bacterium]
LEFRIIDLPPKPNLGRSMKRTLRPQGQIVNRVAHLQILSGLFVDAINYGTGNPCDASSFCSAYPQCSY